MNLTLLKHNYFIDSYLNKDFFSTTNTKELRKRGGTPKLKGIERNLNTKESISYLGNAGKRGGFSDIEINQVEIELED